MERLKAQKPRKDETGKVYGRLTVLGLGERRRDASGGNHIRYMWRCRCECGAEVEVLGDLLRLGSTRSCGCLMGPIDEIGNRYARLVVLSQGPHDGKFITWLCQCDCGNQVTTRAGSLRSGATRSCGCITTERLEARALPPRIRGMNVAFNNMRQNAKIRELEWGIPDDILEHLCGQNCFYCDAPPSNRGPVRTNDGAYLYSGLDRIDNTRGYFVDNVVPSCKTCNLAKGTMTFNEFMVWVRRIFINLNGSQVAEIIKEKHGHVSKI